MRREGQGRIFGLLLALGCVSGGLAQAGDPFVVGEGDKVYRADTELGVGEPLGSIRSSADNSGVLDREGFIALLEGDSVSDKIRIISRADVGPGLQNWELRIPAKAVLSKSVGLPGFYTWKMSLPVEPYYAYRISWSTDLHDGFNSGSLLEWKNLGHEVTAISMRPTHIPVFVKVDYYRAFAPQLLPDEIYSLLLEEIEGGDQLTVTPRSEENRFDLDYRLVEEGIEATFFGGIAYARTDLNAAEIRFTLGTVRLRELSSGEILDFDIQQLAALSDVVLPMGISGTIQFTGVDTGSMDFKTFFTDQSEGDFKTVSF